MLSPACTSQMQLLQTQCHDMELAYVMDVDKAPKVVTDMLYEHLNAYTLANHLCKHLAMLLKTPTVYLRHHV